MIKRNILLGSALILFAGYASFASAMLSKCKREDNAAVSLQQSSVNQLFLNACEIGDLDLVRHCVEILGADRDARCEIGYSGRHNAAFNGHLSILKYLLKDHDYPEDKRNDDLTPFHLAFKGDYLDIIQWYFQEKKTEIHYTDEYGIKLIHLAAFHGSEKILRYLIQKTPQVQTQTTLLHEAFGVACKMEHIGAARLFLPYVDINRPVHLASHMTLLYLLAGTGKIKGVKLLMENGANPDLRTKEGFTAIQAAKTGGFLNIVQLFEKYSRSKKLSEELLSSETHIESKKKIAKPVLLQKPLNSVAVGSHTVLSQTTAGKENKKPQLVLTMPSANSMDIAKKSAKPVKVNDCVHIFNNQDGYKKSSIFLFPNNAQTGTYYFSDKKTPDLIEVPQDLDNVGAQLSSNHLALAGYSMHVKEKMALKQDIFHNFSPTLEKKHGHLAQTNIIDFKLYPQKKQYWKEQLGKSMPIENRWFELHCQIPAQIRPGAYSVDKAKAQGPTGFIKYVVLAEGLADHHEKTIVHRCFEISKK